MSSQRIRKTLRYIVSAAFLLRKHFFSDVVGSQLIIAYLTCELVIMADIKRKAYRCREAWAGRKKNITR